MIQCSSASDLQRREETENVPNELLDFLHVMLLGEEGLDLDQQFLLDDVWHKLPTFGSDCPDQLLLGDILKTLLFNHLLCMKFQLLPPARLYQPIPEVLLQPLLLPGLHQSLLNCRLYRGIHGRQSANSVQISCR